MDLLMGFAKKQTKKKQLLLISNIIEYDNASSMLQQF